MSPPLLLPGATLAAPLTPHTSKGFSLSPLKLEVHGVPFDEYRELSLLHWDLAPQLGWGLHEDRDMALSPDSGLIIGALQGRPCPPREVPTFCQPVLTASLPQHPLPHLPAPCEDTKSPLSANLRLPLG